MKTRKSKAPVGIWLSGTALGVCCFMIAGLVGLLAFHGLGALWPRQIEEATLKDGTRVWGEIWGEEEIPDPDHPDAPPKHRTRYKIGNRDLYGLDFRWIDHDAIGSRGYPPDLAAVERMENGNAYGRVVSEDDRTVVLETAGGKRIEIPRSGDKGIVRLYRPNAMGLPARAGLYLSRLWEFVSAAPRESNTEGGIFPAICGTVLMVLVMTLIVTPFGVLAALYLREYARQSAWVQLVRIAVNNLAGVPSIVFGMFGLGFFVYGVGGAIDRTLFAGRLPSPTFGTGGMLWASLTLALLTVPVVIVATEEALVSVPRGLREASLALGSTQFQTIWKVVLPAALPGILTGVILAMARGAGEVAPLMLTGAVKLSPIPVDGQFPFVHLEGKFMHLGFHVYDVGFQSPNVEAAKPMVYLTAFLLLGIVVATNLAAMVLRARLREKLKTSAV